MSLDYDKLATAMANGLERYRVYYYNCPRWMPTNPTVEDRQRQARQDQFFAKIRSLPRFEVRLGKLKYRGRDEHGSPIFQQKAVDILLAIDVMRIAMNRTASTVVLLAGDGDGDYAPLVQTAKDAGVITRLYHGANTASYAAELWSACDERAVIDGALVQRARR
jgi:uncharacterized LabA/DUF88 family protein